MLKESTGDKSTEEEKKEVTRRMDVREQLEKRSPSGAVTERETQQEGAKEREGLGESFLKRGGGGRTVSAVGVSGPAQLCNSSQLRQLREQNPVFLLQFSQCHLQSCSRVSLQ